MKIYSFEIPRHHIDIHIYVARRNCRAASTLRRRAIVRPLEAGCNAGCTLVFYALRHYHDAAPRRRRKCRFAFWSSKWRRFPEEWLRGIVLLHRYLRDGGWPQGGGCRGVTSLSHHTIAHHTALRRSKGWKRGSAVLRRTPALWRRDDPRRGESGRSLLGARAFPLRYAARCMYDATARRAIAFVRTAPPLSDPESRAPTLRDQVRESGCAGGVSLWTTRRTVRSQKTRGDPRGKKREVES